ncbi:RHS repeat protein [Catenulispora rubra]|uniref:RHS repeat protein n=1 Tax=Catenulispora rubra TaxID=280293 RepID=UPI0018920C7D|nr:RHS repeat protein [Catenulispora rubra]
MTPHGNVTAANAAAYTIAFGYDANGNRTTVTDPLNLVTATGYDATGEITSTTDPLGHAATATYDALGHVLTSVDRDGNTTTSAYDADGDRISQTTAAGETIKWTYDADGRIASSIDPRGTGTGGSPAAYTTGYGYDAAGNPTTVTAPLGGVQSTVFDGDSRQTSTTDPMGAVTSFGYDAGSRLTGVTAPDGGATTTYGYDPAGCLTSACITPSATTGCPTGSTITAYTYDADGNQTAAGTTASTYNAADQMSGATSGGTAYAFTYDAAGNRVTTATGGTTTRTQTWDPNNPLPQLATTTGTGATLIGDYHYDPLGTIASERTAAGAFYDTHDYLGSVTDLLSSTGVDQYTDTYDAFGTQTVNTLTSTAPVQPFGYTGTLTDPTLAGKIDMRARTMDPSTGRFASRDPHSPTTGGPYVSAYAYAVDAPTYLTDPGNFFDTYVPVRPAYRLYHIADLLRQEGCPQLADLYSAAGDQLAGQIAIDGISGLTGWERDAAAIDATAADSSATTSTTGGAASSWFTAPTAGSGPPIALLGKYQDIKDYIAAAPPGTFDADFLNFQGTAKKGTAGVGSWNWTRNKRYIDDALAAGKEVRLVTDPNTPLYEKGNVYQRELKYLKDNGYGWVPVDDYWVVVRVRP